MKDIPGYEGLYAVTSDGQVWSYRRNIFLRPAMRKGYLAVHLRKNGKGKSYYIHRLVGLVFIPNPQNLETIDHIDGNKLNNNADNLQWLSRTNNIRKYWHKELKEES